jgi:cytochrome c oxidase subunit 2
MRFAAKLSQALTALILAGQAVAQNAPVLPENLPVIGAPVDRGLGFQPAATASARDIQWLDGFLLVIISVICTFVLLLLAAVILRYNRRMNLTPKTFTHNSPLEVTWTIVPIVILMVIGAYSLPVLFKEQTIPEGDVVIKATGSQWLWTYEYVDEGVSFESYMIGHPATITSDPADAEIIPYVFNDAMEAKLESYGYTANEFLLATDTAVVVPTGKVIVVQVTASDVIHSWALPAFGVKQDGVPGRLAELWFEVEPGMEGIYFGQCSELCGKDHAYMPITVKAVTEADYEAWLASVKPAETASN